MKFGIDLDGVLVDNYSVWTDYFNQQAKKGCHPEFIWEKDDAPIWDYFEPVCQKCWHDCLTMKEIVSSYIPRLGAYDALNYLKNEGIELHLITSRPKQVVSFTYEWVATYFPEIFKSITVTFDKVGVIKEKGIYGAVDDAPHNIEAFNHAGIPVLIWDMPYNKEYPGIRVFDWESFLNTVLYLDSLEKISTKAVPLGRKRKHTAKLQGVNS